MHAHDPIHFGFWMCYFCSDELHPIESHRTREDNDSASRIHERKVVAQVAPRQVNKRELLAPLRHVEGYVFS